MSPDVTGWQNPLYLLAFDHRGSFQKTLLGITGEPTAAERARIGEAKRIIFDALEPAVDAGVPRAGAGILVDEEFGAGIARHARTRGVLLAMPAEKSGQDEFDFEYGRAFGEHVETFDPDFVKVLVRYNPQGDRQLNLRQVEKLRVLSEWLHDRERRFLFELLVPATPDQLAAVAADASRYDLELRPGLVLETMAELQAAGVEPDVWKIEGLDRREDCERCAEQARAGGRDGVSCIVLGRGSSAERAISWLRAGAGVPGFVGFAIGRTLWFDELARWVAGELTPAQASAAIADNYRRMVDAWLAAEAPVALA